MNATKEIINLDVFNGAAEAGCLSTSKTEAQTSGGRAGPLRNEGNHLKEVYSVDGILNDPQGRPLKTLPFMEVEEVPELQNRKKPYYENKQERPNHRIMIELAAKGYDVKEIAEMTGYTTVCVNNILRQPNLQKCLVNEIRQQVSADEEVVEIIRKNVVKSIQLYESVLNDPKAEMKLKMEAAERLLNRRYGKPNQPINRGSDVDLNELPDSELLKMAKGN